MRIFLALGAPPPYPQNSPLPPIANFWLRVCLTACIFAIIFFLLFNYCIIYKRSSTLWLETHSYSIKPMKLSANAGPKQAIAAYFEMQFHNISLMLVLPAG